MAKNNKYYLNKVESFYVVANPEGKTAEELAEELKKTVNAVTKVQEEAGVNTKEIKQEAAKEETHARKLLGRHKRGNKYVATVMTEAASQVADENRNRSGNKKYHDSIYHPFGEDHDSV